MIYVTCSIVAKIDDEPAFRRTAYDRCVETGLGEEEANCYLDPEDKTLGDCAVMIFDPGVSPNGCSIQESGAEESQALPTVPAGTLTEACSPAGSIADDLALRLRTLVARLEIAHSEGQVIGLAAIEDAKRDLAAFEAYRSSTPKAS